MGDFFANTQVPEHTLRRMRTLLVTLLFLLPTLYSATAQDYSSTNRRAIKAFDAGREAIQNRDYPGAIEQFRKAVERDPGFWEAHYSLGQSLEVNFDTAQAVIHWQEAARLGTSNAQAQALYYKVGMYYLRRQAYPEAQANLQSFLDAGVGSAEAQRRAQRGLDQIAFVKEAMANPVPFEPVLLPRTLNAFAMQYFPLVNVQQDQLIFTGRRVADIREDEDIYISVRDPELGWMDPVSLSDNINTGNLNEGTCTLSADGRTLIFTSCQRSDVIGSCDLYVSYKRGSEWSKPINMGPRINTRAWESQPSLSADGRTLYFVSRRPGGQGNSDIWVSRLQADNSWGYPTNLGPTINTEEDDLSPFIHVNGRTLYFASEGHLGLGSFDLFKTEWEQGKWSEPENLGYPINDPGSQVSLFITADGTRGFYSKDGFRNGAMVSSKIYTFELPENAQTQISSTYVRGRVYDEETETPMGAWIDLMDLEADSVLGQVRSDPITGEYLMVLNRGAEYGLFAQEKDYLYQSIPFSYDQTTQTEPIEIDIYLSPLQSGKVVVMNNVFFDTDSYQLRDKSKTELNRVVRLLRDNGEIRMEISGHTDDVGEEEYNQSLSENRAKAVYEFLVSQGVPARRLRYRGYGESKPRVANDSDEHRQVNRRIEFVIYR